MSTIAGYPCTCNAKRPGLENASQCYCAVDCAAAKAPLVSCGGAPAASCIALLRGVRRRAFLTFHRRICPNGKMQWHSVKVGRMVWTGKQSGRAMLKVNILSRRTSLPGRGACFCSHHMLGGGVRPPPEASPHARGGVPPPPAPSPHARGGVVAEDPPRDSWSDPPGP